MKTLFLLMFLPMFLFGRNPLSYPIIRYIDALGKKPTGYLEWKQRFVDAPVEKKIISKSGNISIDSPVFVIVITPKLVAPLINELATFQTDLQNDGFSVVILSWSGGNYIELREELKSQYQSGATHVLMIGDLPLAWYEQTRGDFHGEYPVDMYFTDMDGTWTDRDNDGKIDQIPGHVNGKLAFGRLYASRLSWGSEISLLKNYFRKNHLYRTGGYDTVIPRRALIYLDTFRYYSDPIEGMKLAYDDITAFYEDDSTTAAHFKREMKKGYEWVHLLSHSSPWGDTFLVNGEDPCEGTYLCFEPQALNPPCIFFALEACMVNRYVEQDNIGNWYLFTNDYSLVSIGEARTAYAIHYDSLYVELAKGKTLGQAYNALVASYSVADLAGMTLLGDPSLKIRTTTKYVPDSAKNYPVHKSRAEIEKITNSGFSDGNSNAAVDINGKIWVVFESARNTRMDIYAAYNDGSWHDGVVVEDYHYWDACPNVCSDDLGGTWFVWQNYRYGGDENFDIIAKYWDGNAFGSPKRLTTPLCCDTEPSFAAGQNGKMMLIYKNFNNTQADIYSLFYDGTSWQTSPDQLSNGKGEHYTPSIGYLGDGKYLALWVEATDSYSRINWSIYDEKWSSPATISGPSGYVSTPAISSKNGLAVASWILTDTSGKQKIMTSKWNGTSFDNARDALNATGIFAEPNLLITNAGLYYMVFNVKSATDWEVALTISDDAVNWATPEIIASDPAQDLEPVIVQNKSDIKVIWYSDRTDDTFAVYGYNISESSFYSRKSAVRLPDKLRISTYPNPVKDVLNISFNREPKTAAIIKIYDLSGRLVKEARKEVSGKSCTQKINNLKSGVYFYIIEADSEKFDGKILKIGN
ncbi:MAG: T9SS type A sorting domain-containing protein [Candidatus Coatesbacteria bacterium]|nr:T9SS type A sorting domain-containing protein [Candidatus Coatesbacteria bacterium]